MLRRTFLRGLGAAGTALLMAPRVGLGTDATSRADAVTVDFHSHAWRRPGFAADLRQGKVDVVVMVATSDRLLLNRDSGRFRALGTFEPGALYANTAEQLNVIEQAIETERFVPIRSPADVQRARAADAQGILVGCEGGDVLEGSLDRMQTLHERGVRLIQLVHYRVNELGDIQTEATRYNGLTPFGADVVRSCNKLGIIVDVAHATFDVTRQAAKVATRPLLLSHTYHRESQTRYSRGITRAHARTVSETGGVVGVVPFPNAFPSLQDYAEGIARMVDAVGVDHVGIGGDLGGIIGRPPYQRFAQFPEIAQALRDRGFVAEDVGKIAGGNFMRLFRMVTTGV